MSIVVGRVGNGCEVNELAIIITIGMSKIP
jgi:hypothetical protein